MRNSHEPGRGIHCLFIQIRRNYASCSYYGNTIYYPRCHSYQLCEFIISFTGYLCNAHYLHQYSHWNDPYTTDYINPYAG